MSTTANFQLGAIRNVKLLGFESKNGRIYPPNVVKKALDLYEGAKVNLNHPEGSNPARPRVYQDRIGVIRNVRFDQAKGLFGDFHLNDNHPAAPQIRWDAENNPEALGFSHNAVLKMGPVQKDGLTKIEEIVAIRSVDLVADPATTAGLFESVNRTESVESLRTQKELLERTLNAYENQKPNLDRWQGGRPSRQPQTATVAMQPERQPRHRWTD